MWRRSTVDKFPYHFPVWPQTNTMSMVKFVATDSSYDNRFISVVTIEGRKIVQWRDYMDSLAAITALSQVQ